MLNGSRLIKIQKNARAVVGRHRHLAWRLSLEDLEQEALLAQVDASTRYRAEGGAPFGAFAWRAAVVASYRFTLVESAPVSGRHNPEVLVDLHRTEFAEVAHESEAPPPDRQYERAEWTYRVRARLASLLGEDGAAFALDVLTGEYKPREVQEAHDVPIERVYRAIRSIKQLISGDAELLNLWGEL